MKQYLRHCSCNSPNRRSVFVIASAVCAMLIASVTTASWGEDAQEAEAVVGALRLSVHADSRANEPISGFAQDEVTLAEDRPRLTLSTELVQNDHAGFESQPSSRLVSTPDESETVRGALSGSVGTQSSFEDGVPINGLPSEALFRFSVLALMAILGDLELRSEDLLAYEPEYYTARWRDRLSLDVTTSHNTHDNPQRLDAGTARLETFLPPAQVLIPASGKGKTVGKTYGVGLASDLPLSDSGRQQAAYTDPQTQLHIGAASGDTPSETAERENRDYRFSSRSSLNLPKNPELERRARYAVGHTTSGASLRWSLAENLELFIVGRDPLQASHAGLILAKSSETQPVGLRRTVYLGLTLKF